MDHFKKIFLSLIMFLLILNLVYASEPNYAIIIRLADRNIKSGENVPLKIDIKGAGTCSDGGISLIPESDLNLTYSIYYSNTLKPTELGPMIISNITLSPLDEDTQCDPYLTSSHHINLPEEFTQNEKNYLRFDGTLVPSGTLEGGDYSVNVIFFCKSNETWYTFEGHNEFHVMYEGEQFQYIPNWLILIAGAFLGFLLTLWSNNTSQKNVWKKEYAINMVHKSYGPLYNEFMQIEKQFNAGEAIENPIWTKLKWNYLINMIPDEDLIIDLKKFYKDCSNYNALFGAVIRIIQKKGGSILDSSKELVVNQLDWSDVINIFVFKKDLRSYSKEKDWSENYFIAKIKEEWQSSGRSFPEDFFERFPKELDGDKTIQEFRKKHTELTNKVKDLRAEFKKIIRKPWDI